MGIRISALKSSKARLWLIGRKNIFQQLQQHISATEKNIWFHCASLGEFEQGRPVIEKIRSVYPQYKILVTFFSPSGYTVQKNFNGADYIFYLPLDSRANANQFLDIVRPSLVVFVKYEFWYYYFKAIRQRQIPFLLVSAVFRNSQPFFKWYGLLHRKMLDCISHVFVQDVYSKQLLEKIGLDKQVSIAGDTRFDRVVEIAGSSARIEAIERFCAHSQVIVAGSTWADDEKLLRHTDQTSLKLIIAPHETNSVHLSEIKKIFPSAVFYSELDSSNPNANKESTVLIIDSVGMLSRLYKYATLTYVGGGFTADGIHNVLEAAVYRKPVLFGPNYQKYREAVELIEAGAAISIARDEEFVNTVLRLLQNKEEYNSRCQAAGDYVMNNAGATTKIIGYIQENRLLTS